MWNYSILQKEGSWVDNIYIYIYIDTLISNLADWRKYDALKKGKLIIICTSKIAKYPIIWISLPGKLWKTPRNRLSVTVMKFKIKKLDSGLYFFNGGWISNINQAYTLGFYSFLFKCTWEDNISNDYVWNW